MPIKPSKRDWKALSEEERIKAAFAKVLRSATLAEQSTAKMRSKLLSAGFPADSAEAAIDKALELGIIDDRRYSDSLIRSHLSMGKGIKFAEEEIEELGISPYELDSYIDYMEQGEDAHIQAAVDYLESHPPHGKNVRDSAYRKLVGKGYPSHIASSAARVYSANML